VIDDRDRANFFFLFDVLGVKTGDAMNYAVEKGNELICKWLVVHFQVDPFAVCSLQSKINVKTTSMIKMKM
jgi:hypothetical protein